VKYVITLLTFSACIGLGLLGWHFGKVVYLIMQTEPYTQVGTGQTLLVLGDSTGYGTGVFDARDSIAGRIGQDYPNLTIMNDSTNGRTIGELVPVVASLTGRYDYILLQIGGNDVLQLRDPDQVGVELDGIFDTLRQHTDHIIMMSSGNVGGARRFTDKRAKRMTEQTLILREVFQRTALENGVVYVDLFVDPAQDPFILDTNRYQAIDGLHPSGAGYGLWYEVLKPVLATIVVDDKPQ